MFMLRQLAPGMAWWLAVAMLLAPLLGAMHEVVHGRQHAPVHSAVAQAAPADAATSAAHAKLGAPTPWLLAGWEGHALADCLVLDQLAHAMDSAVHVQTLQHAAPQPPAQPAAVGQVLATVAAAFHARAPPLYALT